MKRIRKYVDAEDIEDIQDFGKLWDTLGILERDFKDIGDVEDGGQGHC